MYISIRLNWYLDFHVNSHAMRIKRDFLLHY